jgi:signal transduction histidine kinase
MEPVLKRLVLDKIGIRVASSHQPIPVLADEASLNQIMLNLIINARDAMPHGGTATIDMGIIDLGDPLAPTLGIMPGRYAGVSVRDSGHGIPSEIQRHVFEPFFTTKSADKGTGLGLSIVYGIVKGLGGAIEVQSEVGEGATFTVYLPLITDGNGTPAK